MRKEILIVDDAKTIRLLLRMTLEAEGFSVIEAGDASEALQRLDGRKIDLIMSDLNMPVMDGISATQAIRRLPDRQDLPIIALTANAMAEDRDRCLHAGMNDFVSKPVDPQQLLAVLSRWLPHQVPLAEAANRRVAAHRPDRVEVETHQRGARTHPGRHPSRFDPGMPAADNDDVKPRHGGPISVIQRPRLLPFARHCST